MRLRRTELRRRINADLVIRSGDSNLSSHAGLELLRRLLSRIEFTRLLRDKACRQLPRSDFWEDSHGPGIACADFQRWSTESVPLD